MLRALRGFLATWREMHSGASPAPPSAPPAAPPPAQMEAPPGASLSEQDRDILVRTLYGEARGETEAGQAAVVHVIRNRVLARKTSAAIECTRPWQFSCWNAGDPNLPKIVGLRPADPRYVKLGEVVDRAWRATDTVQGARHYYAVSMPAPPSWARHPKARRVAAIGGHVFLADVP